MLTCTYFTDVTVPLSPCIADLSTKWTADSVNSGTNYTTYIINWAFQETHQNQADLQTNKR